MGMGREVGEGGGRVVGGALIPVALGECSSCDGSDGSDRRGGVWPGMLQGGEACMGVEKGEADAIEEVDGWPDSWWGWLGWLDPGSMASPLTEGSLLSEIRSMGSTRSISLPGNVDPGCDGVAMWDLAAPVSSPRE